MLTAVAPGPLTLLALIAARRIWVWVNCGARVALGPSHRSRVHSLGADLLSGVLLSDTWHNFAFLGALAAGSGVFGAVLFPYLGRDA